MILLCLSVCVNLVDAQGTPPGFSNGVEWNILVEDSVLQIAGGKNICKIGI